MITTRKTLSALVAMCLIVLLSGSAQADWNPGDPHKMHYPQLPDLSPTGMDVLANAPYPQSTAPMAKILADDWQCSASGAVTDIHIWGSWWEDILPTRQQGDLLIQDPGNVVFRLSIHTDIPAVVDPSGAVISHSRPGEKLWERFYTPGNPDWSVRLYKSGISELFYDPNINQIVGVDTAAYQYNFFVDPADAFYQQQGTIYWLDVVAGAVDLEAVFGWKTSLDHFNDDAVWGDAFGTDPSADPQEWFELRYPDGHELQGQSIDLAFVITPEPATMLVLSLGLVPVLMHKRRKA